MNVILAVVDQTSDIRSFSKTLHVLVEACGRRIILKQFHSDSVVSSGLELLPLFSIFNNN